LELDEIANGQPNTELLYLRDMALRQSQARVIKVVYEKGTHAYLVLDQTIFLKVAGNRPTEA